MTQMNQITVMKGAANCGILFLQIVCCCVCCSLALICCPDLWQVRAVSLCCFGVPLVLILLSWLPLRM